MLSIIILSYIILSYYIIKTVVNSASLLSFYIIIPILNKLNFIFSNNILLNISFEKETDDKTNIYDKRDEVDTEDEVEDKFEMKHKKIKLNEEEILVDETYEIEIQSSIS